MIKQIIIIQLIICFVVVGIAGCIESNETGDLYITGKVRKIEESVIFGGTFTDWRTDIYFEGEKKPIWVYDDEDLSSIELNKTGKFHFTKNYFDYEGVKYEFHHFIRVEYIENEYK